MPKVSVIVPVYNVEPYLRDCLDSVVNQTHRNLEIIIIDDGSTDGSTAICRYYASIDPRVKLIVQKNQGVAAARKKASEYANGKYIGFVDADDYIEPDLFEQLVNSIGDCDLATSGFMQGGNLHGSDKLPKGSYRTTEQMGHLIDNMICFNSTPAMGIIRSMSAKLFKTDMAKAVFHAINEDIVNGEDGDFLYRYILQSGSVVVTDICGYYYRLRKNSATHSPNRGYIKNISDVYYSLEPVFRRHPRHDTLIPQLQFWILQMLRGVPRQMGFSLNARVIEYISPFLNRYMGQRVVLYGAGAVGQSYYLQMMAVKGNEPVIWVDKGYEHYRERLPVQPVEALDDVEFDHLLIAVAKEELAQSIKKELLNRGIAEEKILWEKPLRTLL